MRKIVAITGSKGFIATHLINELRKDKTLKILPLDLKDGHDVSRIGQMTDTLEGVDTVFHLATMPLPVSLNNPYLVINEIVTMSLVLCELARQKVFKTLIQVSSSEAYGNCLYSPMSELHPLNPRTPYASSKASADLIALSYHKTFDIDVKIARCFNAYGPGQPLSWGAVIPKTITKILQGEQPVIFKDGKQSRDFVYVKDIVNGIIGVYKHAQAGDLVNIGSGVETPINELVALIAKLAGYKGKIKYEKQRVADVSRLCANTYKARQMFGFKAQTPLEEGLKKTIAYYKNGKEILACVRI